MIRETADHAAEYARSWLQFKHDYSDIPGFSVAIRLKGEEIFSEAYGMADLGEDKPLTPDHTFRVASHSKMFTATALMQLQEQGRLRISDPVIDHVPWLADHSDKRWENVTVSHLMSHAAGVSRDGTDSDFWLFEKPFPDADELKAAVLSESLVLEPAAAFKYSNYGYGLLGAVVESAADMPWGAYVTENVIQPLGLAHTYAEYDPATDHNLATGYTPRTADKRFQPIGHIGTGALAAATGIVTNAGDLAAFLDALRPGNSLLLKDAHKREMIRIHNERKFKSLDNKYGLGIKLLEMDGTELYGHGGGFPGYKSCSMTNPEHDLTVAFIANTIDSAPEFFVTGLHKIFRWFEKHASTTKAGTTGEAGPNLKRFEGRFSNILSSVDIVSSGTTIVANNPSAVPFDNAIELDYIDDSTLDIVDTHGLDQPGETIRYSFDTEGAVARIRYGGYTGLPDAVFRAEIESKPSITLS